MLTLAVISIMTHTPAGVPGGQVWGAFGIVESNRVGANVDVEIDSRGADWILVRTEHRLKRAEPGQTETIDVVTWADSHSCPAVKEQLKALASVTLPTMDLPIPVRGASPGAQRQLRDGAATYLDVPASFGLDGFWGSKNPDGRLRPRLRHFMDATVHEGVGGLLETRTPED